MLNQIVLVGRIKELSQIRDKKEIILEVDRPFKDGVIKESDTFVCRAWGCIFNKILNFCNNGDLLAIKGRMINENNELIVVAENISILNKSKNSISKSQ